jgi:hypothetical protein
MTLEVPDLDNILEQPLDQRVLGPILRARAERDPDKIYIRFGDKAWTFANPCFIFGWYVTNLGLRDCTQRETSTNLPL